MRIEIPVNNSIETIVVDIYIKSEVNLMPVVPTRTTEAKLVIERIQTVLNEKIYTAIQEALKQVDKE